MKQFLVDCRVQDRLAKKGGDMRFSEFVYQSFQAYDWLQLHKNYGCSIQVNYTYNYHYVWNIYQCVLLSNVEIPAG